MDQWRWRRHACDGATVRMDQLGSSHTKNDVVAPVLLLERWHCHASDHGQGGDHPAIHKERCVETHPAEMRRTRATPGLHTSAIRHGCDVEEKLAECVALQFSMDANLRCF
mmetsp:Transcript_11245/g.69456  ORF Transcript_11245/g.69456 Transcript_11245/m.69456 type:complete len:111 (+) Transcript_11245:2473-2805(+)